MQILLFLVKKEYFDIASKINSMKIPRVSYCCPFKKEACFLIYFEGACKAFPTSAETERLALQSHVCSWHCSGQQLLILHYKVALASARAIASKRKFANG